jgi:hypothetical protein
MWQKQLPQAIVEAERAIALNPNFAEGVFDSGKYSDLCRAAAGID